MAVTSSFVADVIPCIPSEQPRVCCERQYHTSEFANERVVLPRMRIVEYRQWRAATVPQEEATACEMMLHARKGSGNEPTPLQTLNERKASAYERASCVSHDHRPENILQRKKSDRNHMPLGFNFRKRAWWVYNSQVSREYEVLILMTT